MIEQILQIASYLATIIILYAFVANAIGRITVNSVTYNVLNFVGAMWLIVYFTYIGAWSGVILNVVWAAVAFRGIAIATIKREIK